MIIQKCTQLPPNFPVTGVMVDESLVRGLSLEEEMKVIPAMYVHMHRMCMCTCTYICMCTCMCCMCMCMYVHVHVHAHVNIWIFL